MKKWIGYNHAEIDNMYPYEFDIEYWMSVTAIQKDNEKPEE